jgi:hypothetical protein
VASIHVVATESLREMLLIRTISYPSRSMEQSMREILVLGLGTY